MGQYYRPILGDAYGFNCIVFDRSVDDKYTLAKLMEHSGWLNPFVNSFAAQIYNCKSRVCWVGDYADEPNDFKFTNNSAFYVPNYKEVWGDKVNLITSHSTDFTLDGKFLLNHDTKEFSQLGRVQRDIERQIRLDDSSFAFAYCGRK